MQVTAFNRVMAGRSDATRFLMAAMQRRLAEEHPLSVSDMLTYSPVRTSCACAGVLARVCTTGALNCTRL